MGRRKPLRDEAPADRRTGDAGDEQKRPALPAEAKDMIADTIGMHMKSAEVRRHVGYPQ
jgi:hypothetical protein